MSRPLKIGLQLDLNPKRQSLNRMSKNLRTIKKAAAEIGASPRFLTQLLEEGKLTRFKINTATYISLEEFESIAIPIKKQKIQNA
jgi:hypothetical protein